MARRRRPLADAAAATSTSTHAGGDGAEAPGTGYAAALHTGFRGTTHQVQAMHRAIAGRVFGGLSRVPGLSVPTRLAQGLHDAIADGVYSAVRHGGAVTSALAEGVERRVSDPHRAPGAGERVVRGALNGVFGDTLEAAGSGLAVRMGLHDLQGPLQPDAPRVGQWPERVCVFLHGLACDEHSWRRDGDVWANSPWADQLPAGEAIHYGALLAREPNITAVWLRYNSGLPIEENARRFAELLDAFARAAPQVREWRLVGHSMGGLVARSAHALAAARRDGWALRVPVIVCLGSPHQGAPLEKAGRLVTAALGLSNVTRPLGRIAGSRSRGIRDLRLGLQGSAMSTARPALRMVSATLLADGAGGAIGPWVSPRLGDGLVGTVSASDDGLAGDVERVALSGLGHLALLNHPRVYAVIRPWLLAPFAPGGS